MPVPTDISTLSTTASTNYPAGIEFAYEGDNHLRQIYAFFAYMRDGFHGRRNRIINGDMRIDQRNSGSSVTINSTANTYTLDRWVCSGQAADGVFTVARSTSTPPDGFSHFLRVTVTTADASIGSSQSYLLVQNIEGQNVVDLAWGGSAAQAASLSFRVRSSVTGTFSGAITNSAGDRSYPFSFTINSANTWETKTVAITGDTTGAWLTTSGIGIAVIIDLGAGTSKRGTASAWAASGLNGVTSAVSLISTLNATFDITGVQFEAGAQPTGFEHRQYTTELQLCQRYFCRMGDSAAASISLQAYAGGANVLTQGLKFPVAMRIAPTGTVTGTWTATNCGQPTFSGIGTEYFNWYVTATGAGAVGSWNTDTAKYFSFTAEL